MTRLIPHVLLLTILMALSVAAQTTFFTYQGRLNVSSSPTTGIYDFEFLLFDAPAGGAQIGPLLVQPNVAVLEGIFTVQLDFGGASFPSSNRYLEIHVRPAGSGTFTTLNPRQWVTASPYSIQSLNAATAANANALGGVGAAAYLQSTGSGANLTDLNASSITSGTLPLARLNNGVILNGGATQTGASFNISGTGIVGSAFVAGSVNSSNGYSIGGLRVLSNPGTDNIFGGASAGASAMNTGINNSFFGVQSGQGNTSGGSNTFIGNGAGNINTNGSNNTFVGALAGSNSLPGNNNTVIGKSATVNSAVTFATAIGSWANTAASDTITIGKPAGTYEGNARPADFVRMNGNALIAGDLRVGVLAVAGNNTQICHNNSYLSFCSSSRRYKDEINDFPGGVDLIKRFRPVSFTWKNTGRHDIGFIAEDVAEIEPRLTFKNNQGEIEGVNYGQVTTLLVNAIKEQQAQIEAQQKIIETQQKQAAEQQAEIKALKELVCRGRERDPACVVP